MVLELRPPDGSTLDALGSDLKGKLSIALYALSIPIAFVPPVVSVATFIIVAAMWFVPDRRLEGRPGTLSE